MKVAIIKYNAGNVQSVIFALKRMHIEPVLTDDAEMLHNADKVIFPGVGEAHSTMKYLRNVGLHQVIPALKQPVLGICLGMQLLCSHSEEGNVECLNIIPQKVKLFRPEKQQNNTGQVWKVPHIGWNTIYDLKSNFFDKKHHNHSHLYFVHSYYVEIGEYTVATTDYIHPFSAAIQKDNFFATQFHPEKSGAIGETILKRFIEN